MHLTSAADKSEIVRETVKRGQDGGKEGGDDAMSRAGGRMIIQTQGERDKNAKTKHTRANKTASADLNSARAASPSIRLGYFYRDQAVGPAEVAPRTAPASPVIERGASCCIGVTWFCPFASGTVAATESMTEDRALTVKPLKCFDEHQPQYGRPWRTRASSSISCTCTTTSMPRSYH